MTLSASARQVIETNRLGFVATVRPDGRPAVSPKGTFLVLSDDIIAFGEIRSPGTLKNLEHLAEAEVNFVDPFTRKGVRVLGRTTVMERGSKHFETLLPLWAAQWEALAERINAIVTISADTVRPLSSPPYDDGATEEEMISLYKAYYADLHP